MRGRPFIITGSVVLLAGGALLAVSSHRRGSPTTAPVIAPNEARAPAAETKPMPPRVPQRPAPAVGPSDPAAAEPAPSPQSPGSYDTYAAVNATPDERRRLDESAHQLESDVARINERLRQGQISHSEWEKQLAAVSNADRDRMRQILGPDREEMLHQAGLQRAEDFLISRQAKRVPQ